MSGLGPSSPSSAESRRGVTGATSRSAPTPVRFSHPGATRPGAARGGVGRRVRGAALPGSNGPGLCTSSYGSIRSDGTGDGPGRRLILAASIEGIALGVPYTPRFATRGNTLDGDTMARLRGALVANVRGGKDADGAPQKTQAETAAPKYQDPTRERRKFSHFWQERECIMCVRSVSWVSVPSRLYIFAHRARLRCPTSEAAPASQPAAALELAVFGQLLLHHEHGARDVDHGRKGVDHTVHGLLRA